MSDWTSRGWHYAEDLHYLDAPWPWGWDGTPDADVVAHEGEATDAATVGRLRARAAHGVSPHLLDAWVQTAQRTRSAAATSVASSEKEQELMIVEVPTRLKNSLEHCSILYWHPVLF